MTFSTLATPVGREWSGTKSQGWEGCGKHHSATYSLVRGLASQKGDQLCYPLRWELYYPVRGSALQERKTFLLFETLYVAIGCDVSRSDLVSSRSIFHILGSMDSMKVLMSKFIKSSLLALLSAIIS